MSATTKTAVCMIDDDADLRLMLKQLMKSSGLSVFAYASAEEFLAQIAKKDIGCLLLDVRLPGMGGMELLETLRRRQVHIPTILLTAYADVPLAVQAMRAGAVDVIEKPFRDEDLLARVRQALARFEELRLFQKECQELQPRIDSLTPRELQVLDLMVAGKKNREIAADLGISVKTLDIHRANLFRKMETKSVANLVRWRMLTQTDPFKIQPM